MKYFVICILFAMTICRADAKTLDIYFIDVEGGQSTLIVTPAGESLLIDTGFPGAGTFQARAGNPNAARDARRILAATRDAGIDHIDYLLITHFHADHVGGVVELAQLLPVHAFIDHGEVLPEAEQTSPGTQAVFAAYTAVRAKGRHIEPNVGDRLPLKEIDAIVVSSAGQTLAASLPGSGALNGSCAKQPRPPQEPNENPRSTGIRLQYGKFRFLDLGDLTGKPLFELSCPQSLLGPVDVYLVAHHGGADAADPATFAAFRPRVAIINNGATKGGAAETFQLLQQIKSIDTWQLHEAKAGVQQNFPDARVANLDESTAHWIKLSANADGSFHIVNGRTRQQTNYGSH